MNANEEDGIPVSCESLYGKWEAVGSEIPEFEKPDSIKQWYHFSDSEFLWDFLHKDGRKDLLRFTYRIREGGFEFGSPASVVFGITAFHVDGFLIIRPDVTGMETWLKRVGSFREGLKSKQGFES